jgi:hypothetical protein
MRQKLKEKDMLISEYQDLAQDVASEFNDLQNHSRAQARAYSKMEVNLKLKADSRLEEVKHSKLKIDSLRESLDSVKETYNDQLEAAQLEIAQLKQELAGQSDYVLHLEDELIHAQEQIHNLTPHIVQKAGKPKTWDTTITQLVVELLAHRTPPSAIAPTILSVTELLMPNANIVKELRGIRFTRYCRTVLAHVTQTLAAYEIALADASNFASANQSLKTYGTIRLDSAAAEGQTRTNNDFGRGHEQLMQRDKSKEPKRGLLFNRTRVSIISLPCCKSWSSPFKTTPRHGFVKNKS